MAAHVHLQGQDRCTAAAGCREGSNACYRPGYIVAAQTHLASIPPHQLQRGIGACWQHVTEQPRLRVRRYCRLLGLILLYCSPDVLEPGCVARLGDVHFEEPSPPSAPVVLHMADQAHMSPPVLRVQPEAYIVLQTMLGGGKSCFCVQHLPLVRFRFLADP